MMLLVIALASQAAIAASDSGSELAAKALAAMPDPEHGKILYLKHCTGCHGRRAWGDGPKEIPALAGQRERYLIEQLARFATGARQGSVMHGPAMYERLQPADVNRPQAISDLAAYLSRAGRDPHPEHAEGQALALGKRTYTRVCAACHGGDGAGSDSGSIPAIGGQHYGYLLAQLNGFVSGLRGHPLGAGRVLSTAEQQAVAAYVARLEYLSSVSAR